MSKNVDFTFQMFLYWGSFFYQHPLINTTKAVDAPGKKRAYVYKKGFH